MLTALLASVYRLRRYLHVLAVLHSSTAGPISAESGHKINDIIEVVNEVAILAGNSNQYFDLNSAPKLQPH